MTRSVFLRKRHRLCLAQPVLVRYHLVGVLGRGDGMVAIHTTTFSSGVRIFLFPTLRHRSSTMLLWSGALADKITLKIVLVYCFGSVRFGRVDYDGWDGLFAMYRPEKRSKARIPKKVS